MPLRFLGGLTKAQLFREGYNLFNLISTDTLNQVSTEYNSVENPDNPLWTNVEANVRQLIPISMIHRRTYVILSAVPGVGNGYIFTLRRTGVSSAIVTVTVQGGDQTGSVIANENLIPAYYDWEVTPFGTPFLVYASIFMYWTPNI